MSFLSDPISWKAKGFIAGTTLLGLAVVVYSLYYSLWYAKTSWLILAALVALASYFPIQIPAAKEKRQSLSASVSDIFIFSAILFYGPEVAAVMASCDALTINLRSRVSRFYKRLFNVAQMSLGPFLTGKVLYLLQEKSPPLDPAQIADLNLFLLHVGMATVLHFLFSSGMVAMAIGLVTRRPVRYHWEQNSFLLLLTNLAAAGGAVLIFLYFGRLEFYALIVCFPIVLLIYYAYLVTTDRMESLRRSRRFLQRSLDALSTKIAILDEGGKIIALNQAWKREGKSSYPFGADYPLGVNYLEGLGRRKRQWSAEAAQLGEGIRQVILNQASEFTLEYACSGEPETRTFLARITRFRGEGPTRVVVAHEDITGLKQAEAALRSSEERYRILFERNLAGVYTGTLEGRILECNDALARILGFESRQELLSLSDWKLEYQTAQSARLRDLLKETPTLTNLEMLVLRRDGKAISILANLNLLQERKGEEPVVQGTVVDLTELKQLKEQFYQAQKLQAIGTLAGGVAHDFNNLLTAIIGYSELALNRLASDSPAAPEILEIRRAAEQAAGLTQQLLAFSRKQQVKPQIVELNDVIRDIEKLLRRLMGEEIALFTILAPDLGPVKIDPGQLQQVVMNLAVNGRDAMIHGGKLTIQTSRVVLDRRQAQRFMNLRPGPYVRLSVSDTGIGMKKALQERIFEPFFTTKEKGKGTGLGLSTVYGIVTQAGGHIEFESEPGVGTTFYVYLPEATQEAAAAPQPGSQPDLLRGSETILLAEDEESIQRLVKGVLEQNGYQVLAASNGQLALELEEGYSGPIHLLLTDVVMPVLNGRELAERVVKRRPSIRVLYMSGYNEVMNQRRPPGESVDLLQKPFSAKVLLQRVRQALEAPPSRKKGEELPARSRSSSDRTLANEFSLPAIPPSYGTNRK